MQSILTVMADDNYRADKRESTVPHH